MCNQGVKCIHLCAVKWQILHCVNIGASTVPDIALSTVSWDLGVLNQQEGEVIVSRNVTKESEANAPLVI